MLLTEIVRRYGLLVLGVALLILGVVVLLYDPAVVDPQGFAAAEPSSDAAVWVMSPDSRGILGLAMSVAGLVTTVAGIFVLLRRSRPNPDDSDISS